MRSGELERGRLEVAAHLGHSASRSACGLDEPFPDFTVDAEDEVGRRMLLLPWALRLAELSRLAARRAAIASSNSALHYYEAVFGADTPRRAIREAERLTLLGLNGDAEQRRLVESANLAAPDRGYYAPPERIERAESASYAAASALAACLPGGGFGQVIFEALHCADAALAPYPNGFQYERAAPCDWSEHDASPASSAAVVLAVQAEVIPWVLGYADLVRERVEAAGRKG
ncbi:MAG: hypothetical protein AB7N76_09810 [Planctomycetota bacterium]